jgi:hydroxymethylglutaryl-CoA reductase
MIGQIQVLDARDPGAIASHEAELVAEANACDPRLFEAGGGARAIETRTLDGMLVCHLLVDCRDAMGANAVNTMCEAIAPSIERITGGRVLLRIVSNLADRRLVTARAVFEVGEAARGVLDAYRFAALDPYRAATNNKGVFNGVASVALATGNDFRALEAGGHAYAARGGRYTSLTRFEPGPQDGTVRGELTLPLAVGLVGGATVAHPGARACVRILGVQTARELAGVLVSVGLAQQLAAMRALVAEGIQRGHMRLHARKRVL